jgi:hypothetical protein
MMRRLPFPPAASLSATDVAVTLSEKIIILKYRFMRKITYFLSLCLLLLMGSTTALADDYTVKKLKSIEGSELTSVDQIQDGKTYVLMFTYRGVYLQYNVLNGNWNGANTLSPDNKNSSLAVVTFHQKKVDGDENTYYTLEAADGYYFKNYSQGGQLGIEASESPALFQVVSGGTETQGGAGNGKTFFFIKPKDGTDMTYMTLNTSNVAIGFGKYGYAQVALIPVTTEGTVTNYEVTFALKEGENTLSTSTSRAWEGETADVSAINNYSTALFDLTPNYVNTTVTSTNKNFTCTLTPKADAPVVLSSADSRKWYSLQTRKTQYNEGQLVADGNNVKCHGAGFNVTDIASYEQFENGLWSFEQSGGGVKIYNKGKKQYLKSTGNAETNRVTFDASGTVFYMGSVSNGTFNLNTGNADSYVGSHNDAVVYLGGWKGQYISVWTDAKDHNSYKDPGSTFTPTSVDNADILAIGKAAFGKTTPERSYTENGVLKKGCYDAAAKASVSEATTFAEMETRVKAAAANVSPEEGAYYLIRNVNKGGYGTETENYKKYLTTAEITCDTNGDVQASVNGDLGIKRLRGTSAFVPRLWQFKKTADGKYNLLNANTNSYVNVASMLTKDNQDQKDAYTIYTTEDAFGDGYNATNDSTTMFVMSSSKSTGYKLLNAANGYNYDTFEGVGTWYGNADAGNYWQFIKVTEVPLTIAANDYTTLCLPFNVKLPENSAVKAYYASAAAGEVLKLEEITNGIIPANEGVILHNTSEAEAANISLAITTDEATLTTNKLKGVTAKREGYTKLNNYVLAAKNGATAFYKANFTAITANKAYLPVANVQGVQGVMMAFSFGDEVTGIDNVNAAAPAAKKYYDLQGRRVLYPAKGIFVTEDGQKVLFK